MERLILRALFLFGACMGWRSDAWAQTTATPTPTSTPNCCQSAQTVTGQAGSGGAFNGAGPEVIYQDILYVEDYENNRIQEFRLNGGAPATLSPIGILPVTFNVPYGLAVAGQYLYVGDFGDDKIIKVDLANNTAVTLATASGQVLGMAVDPTSGEIYASLWYVGVQVFTNGGTPETILSNGMGGAPRGLRKSGNILYVADSGNAQILAFSQGVDGTFSGPQTVIPAVNGPGQIAVDSNQNMYVSATDQIDVYDSGLNLLRTCTMGFSPSGVAVDASGNIFASGETGSTWEVVEIASCLYGVLPTPTPYYQGANPPTPENCFIYPSPARGDHATLSYDMAESGSMDLKILNENGELAAEITDRKPAGVQVTPFDLSRFAPGVYYYLVTLSYDSGKTDKIKVRKFMVIR